MAQQKSLNTFSFAVFHLLNPMFNPSSQYAKVYLLRNCKQVWIGFYAKEAFTIRLKSLSLG